MNRCGISACGHALRFAVFGTLAASCYGGSISLTGILDPNNANDVLLYAFVVGSASTLTIQSYGYGGTSNAPGGTNAAGTAIAAGGFDPYLSLFDGNGPAATFLASNDDGVCPPGNQAPACHDSTLVIPTPAAGSYILALSVFDNFSFAENVGRGTLGDGFIGLGDYFDAASGTVRTSAYALDIDATGRQTTPAPEPATWSLAAIWLAAWILPDNCVRRIHERRSQ